MKEAGQQYLLEKAVWSMPDFEQMGWHDACIYAWAIQENELYVGGDLLLDIDYIFKWVDPEPPAETFSFWLAPCTLVFKDCVDLLINIDAADYILQPLDIVDIHCQPDTTVKTEILFFKWTIELRLGEIKFRSSGFEQLVRQKPMHVPRQGLTLEERGGIGFGLQACAL